MHFVLRQGVEAIDFSIFSPIAFTKHLDNIKNPTPFFRYHSFFPVQFDIEGMLTLIGVLTGIYFLGKAYRMWKKNKG